MGERVETLEDLLRPGPRAVCAGIVGGDPGDQVIPCCETIGLPLEEFGHESENESAPEIEIERLRVLEEHSHLRRSVRCPAESEPERVSRRTRPSASQERISMGSRAVDSHGPAPDSPEGLFRVRP
jgi:hypothetical protein